MWRGSSSQEVLSRHFLYDLQEATHLKKFEKGLDSVMKTVMSIVMLVLIIFGTYQIFTRWILNDPSTFTEELLRYLLVWAGMIGAAYCFFHDQHIKLTLVTGKLHGVPLTIVNVFSEIVCIAFVVYVYIWGGGQMAIKNATQPTAVLRIPMSLIYGCLPVSGILVICSKMLRYVSLYLEKKEKSGGENA